MRFVHLLLFYCFIHTCSKICCLSLSILVRFPARSLPDRHDESAGSHFSRRVSLQLCRGYDPRRMRGKNFTRVHSACSSRTLENLRRPLFIYKPCKLGRSTRRIPRIVSLRHGRYSSNYSPETSFVPRETLEKEKGVLVNRTFRRFVSRSRITKFSRAVEAWKQAARRIVVTRRFHEAGQWRDISRKKVARRMG